MNVLTFYIVKEVLKGSFVALIALLTLFNLFTLSDELKDLGTGNYGLKEVFIYILLTSPRVFYELVPSAALLGSLFVVGAMGNHREIVAMRAAGLSIFWVIKSVMLAGVVLLIIAVFVGEFIAPDAEQKAQLLKTNAQNNKVVMQSKYGLWLREGSQFINVREIKEKGHLADIYIYQLNDANLLSLMTRVDQAHFVGNERWNMQGIRQTEISLKQTFSNRKEQMDWETLIDPDLLNVVVVKSDNMSLYDLFMYIDFLKANNQKSQTYELAFWSRLINPLVTFVMLMVSIPFVVGASRGVGTGSRIMLGIIIGMTFNIFDKITGHLGLVYEFNPMLMAVLPSILVFCGASYAVSRVR
ncbi:MAG: LPS export ABC transporter permease LptG [Methylococcales symbiont of Hymedesmia sp. n. MRB-2018]|nr:MAG: LPS export ABC transporter permease LptG [Methylococcales symbiont of Hymedesmia sp. n. MRB-2018]